MPVNDALDRLRCSDLLILPSRFDGWGAVVNEALMHGVPVVCSSSCGSQDLLRESWRGGVFESEDVSGLRRQILDRLKLGRPTLAERARLIEWTSCITGEAAAKYLISVFEHVYGCGTRPHPPWALAV